MLVTVRPQLPRLVQHLPAVHRDGHEVLRQGADLLPAAVHALDGNPHPLIERPRRPPRGAHHAPKGYVVRQVPHSLGAAPDREGPRVPQQAVAAALFRYIQ